MIQIDLMMQDGSYGIQRTVACAVPVPTTSFSYTAIPDQLKLQLLTAAKPMKPLVTEKDSMRLKVYTNAILRRARIAKNASLRKLHLNQ